MGRFSPTVLPSGINPLAIGLGAATDAFREEPFRRAELERMRLENQRRRGELTREFGEPEEGLMHPEAQIDEQAGFSTNVPGTPPFSATEPDPRVVMSGGLPALMGQPEPSRTVPQPELNQQNQALEMALREALASANRLPGDTRPPVGGDQIDEILGRSVSMPGSDESVSLFGPRERADMEIATIEQEQAAQQTEGLRVREVEDIMRTLNVSREEARLIQQQTELPSSETQFRREFDEPEDLFDFEGGLAEARRRPFEEELELRQASTRGTGAGGGDTASERASIGITEALKFLENNPGTSLIQAAEHARRLGFPVDPGDIARAQTNVDAEARNLRALLGQPVGWVQEMAFDLLLSPEGFSTDEIMSAARSRGAKDAELLKLRAYLRGLRGGLSRRFSEEVFESMGGPLPVPPGEQQ